MNGDLPTEDFHPGRPPLISSCPCWAYTNLLNIITAKKRPSLDAQKTRTVYKKRYVLLLHGELYAKA